MKLKTKPEDVEVFEWTGDADAFVAWVNEKTVYQIDSIEDVAMPEFSPGYMIGYYCNHHSFIYGTKEDFDNMFDTDESVLFDGRFKKGDIVRHFKRETITEYNPGLVYLYRIVDIAKHTETGEDMVIYEALYTSEIMGVTRGELFARPYDMFISEVDHEKYPDIKQKYRFEKEYKYTDI